MYSLNDFRHLRSFTQTIVHNVPMQTTFVDGSKYILSGTDRGVATIFSRSSTQPLVELVHSDGDFNLLVR